MVTNAFTELGGAYLDSRAARAQHQAMSNARQQYQQQLQDYYGREQEANAGFRRQYNDVGDRRLQGIGTTLSGYMATPYGQAAADTGTAQKALGEVGGEATGGLGGAAQGWRNGVDERTQAATGRQVAIAGNANQLQRQQFGQGAALQSQGVADMGFQREHANIAQMEQLRQAALAQQLQNVNINGGNAFEAAGRVGDKDRALAGYLRMGGSLYAGLAGNVAAPAAKPSAPTSASPNWGPTGQQTGGGYHGAIEPQAQNWGPRASQVGGGYYGAFTQ